MIRLLVSLGLFLVGIFVGGALLIGYQPSDPSFRTGYDQYFRCPIRLPRTGGQAENVDWQVYISNPKGMGPHVQVKPISLTRDYCSFDVTRVPVAPFTAVDWRIGHSVTNIEPLRGRELMIQARLRASEPIQIPVGAVYSHDGRHVQQVDLHKLDETVRAFEWTHVVPADAALFEIWFRLTIHGEISNTAEVSLLDVVVEVKE